MRPDQRESTGSPPFRRPGSPCSGAAAIPILALLLAVAAPACAPEPARQAPPSGPAPAAAPAESQDEDPLEHLRGLGYVAWDEGADPEKTGVTLDEAGLASPGYNLFGNGDLEFYLMDLEGEIVHTWTVPETSGSCVHGVMLPDGRLLAICFGRTLFLVDRDSEPIWETAVRAHHSPAVLEGGGFLIPFNELVEHQGRKTLFDGIARISAEGEVSRIWFSHDHHAELLKLHGPQLLDRPPGDPEAERPELGFDYYHMNSVQVLPQTGLGRSDSRFRAGNLLVGLRNVSLIAILDQDDGHVTWHWGPGEVELPHSPEMLPDGRILLFDNGWFRGHSRVIEIDPVTAKIVWSYQGDPRGSFFSKEQGSTQRLPNGNTLICESDRGHAFEVTREGRIVWEYWAPVVPGGKRKRIYRMTRLAPSSVADLLTDAG